MIPPDQSTNAVAGEFLVTLLHAATSAHILHLQTRSFAQHMALDGFYKEMPELADSLIEAYQGKYGIVSYPSGYEVPATTPLEFLSNLSDYIIANRDQVAPDSELQNEIDSIQLLVDSTIYKLRFLA
jgi:hypothetical protein